MQAAMYGAACWAQDAGEELPGVAVIASGTGGVFCYLFVAVVF